MIDLDTEIYFFALKFLVSLDCNSNQLRLIKLLTSELSLR